MSRPPQDEAIATAISDLEWCQQQGIESLVTLAAKRFPHTRWAHGTTNAQMLADIIDDAEVSGDDGYSDPTWRSFASGDVYAMSRWGDNVGLGVVAEDGGTGDSGDDPSRAAIDVALDQLYAAAGDLVILCLGAERIDAAWTREEKLTATIAALHRTQPLVQQVRVQHDRQGRDHLDLLVYQEISETATWLREKGDVLVHGSARAGQPAPQPGDRPKGCVSCARHVGRDGKAYFQPIDEHNHSSRSMCRVCGDYTSGEGEMLPLGAVVWMHDTGKRVTWKVIEEAKRAEMAS